MQAALHPSWILRLLVVTFAPTTSVLEQLVIATTTIFSIAITSHDNQALMLSEADSSFTHS